MDIVTQTATEMAPPLSQKNGTLVAIYQLGGYVQEVPPIVEYLRSKLHINTDPHNVAHVMWPLTRENKITFKERKDRGGSFLTNIRITERGAQTARDLLGIETPPEVGRVISAGRNQRAHAAHQVGQDMTDFRRHGFTAEGGPIEHTKQKETALDSVPFVVLPDEEAKLYRATPPKGAVVVEPKKAQLKQNEKPTDGEIRAEVPLQSAEVLERSSEVARKDESVDTHTEYPGGAYQGIPIQAFSPEGFPHISAVLSKRDKISRYQKAAELLGDDEAEIAIQLLEKVKISPLEEEIIRLVG